MDIDVLAPDNVVKMPVPNYVHGLKIEDAKAWVLLSGQVGLDRDGNVADDFPTQVAQVFENIANLLAAAGMDRDDVAFMRIYLTDRADLPELRKARGAFMGDRTCPSTLVFVSGLVGENWKVEVEIVAAKG